MYPNKTAKKILALAAMVGCIGISAQAQSTFNITFASSTFTAYGQLVVTSGLATGGYLTVTAGPDQGTYPFYTGAGPSVRITGTDLIFDNVVNPSVDPFLTDNGVAFVNGDLTVGFNLWGNGAGNYSLFDKSPTQYYESDGGTATITLVPVPEPTTMALAGLGGLSLYMFRRQRQ